MPLIWQYKGHVLPSLPLAILLSIDSDITSLQNNELQFLEHKIRMDSDSTVLLHYYNQNWYKKVSAVDILTDRASSMSLQGKIVLIGSSAVALHDQVIIPGGESIAGVKVNATFLDNVMNDHLLIQPNQYKKINLGISLALTLLILYLLFNKASIIRIVLFFLSVIIYLIAAVFFFYKGIYLSIGYFLFPFILHFFVISIFEIIFDIFERKLFIEELNKSQIALLDSMVHVAEVHDIETGAHIVRTKKYVKFLAEYIYEKGFYKDQLSPLKIEIIYRTASLHDLGKVGIPDAILKKPGKLTSMEIEVMKTHSMLGVHIINNAIKSYNENNFFVTARNIAHYHHEKFDGSGYPEGIKGQEIPIEARLMAIADVYDALISRRVYKEPFGYDKTIDIIKKGRGTHFDPILVDAFLECKDEFRKIAELYNDANFEKEE